MFNFLIIKNIFQGFREKLAERGIQNNSEMCRRLLEDTGVAILPGSDFGRSPEELTARLAYVDFDGRAAIESLESLADSTPIEEDFLKRQCGNVLEAIDRICNWINP